jgi:hypothetical protein
MGKFVRTPVSTVEPIRIPKHLVYSSIFFLLFFQIFSLAQADAKNNDLPEHELAAGILPLPPSYGKVIFRYNENSPKKIYIIGINHRNCQSRANGSNTAKTQVEVYRIGEWLNRNRQIDLLLPEGYFNPSNPLDDLHLVRQAPPTNNSIIEKKLADDALFVNAETLLMEHFQMPACQVEDRGLYDEVLNRVIKLKGEANDSTACLSLREEIQYLQEKRTAAILQKIPAVIEENFHNGNINSENALFTIGLNHIDTIIKYIEQKAIHIQPPSSNSPIKEDYVADLALLKEGFGIIIIIPYTLVNNQEALKVSKLSGVI